MRVNGLPSGRVGFVVTNGRRDLLVLDDADVDEYRGLLAAGWRVAAVRPICRSQVPRLLHTNPALQDVGAYSYTLVILEQPVAARTGGLITDLRRTA